MNYDQKAQEVLLKTKELEEAQEALSKQSRLMHSKDGELTQFKDTYTNQKKKYTEMMSSLLKDLIDVGECMSDQLTVCLRFLVVLFCLWCIFWSAILL